jgi:DNA-directed RNA polymerase specialized sigma24 family protein
VSETLLRIWQNMAKYRKPGAFLAIVVYEMRNVVRPLWLRPMVLLSLDDYTNEASGQTVDDLLAATYTQELREQVKACFDEMLRRHPRAKQQLEAVWLKYIAGLDDETISILLQKPIANVQVLRTRGMNHLRDSSDWQELATELGL